MKYIVSDDHKFVYFVVQKVACTSIKTALLPLFDIDTSVHAVKRKNDTMGFRVHDFFGASDYQINKKQFMAKLDSEYQDYFKFAFVRNPWDRLVSCYFQKLLDAQRPTLELPDDNVFYKGMPFLEFVEAVCATPDRDANIHFKSQYRTICGPGRDKPVMADFIGRFENLAADFAVVAEKIGAAEKLQLPHRQRSESRRSRPYTELYDDRLKKLVYERYQEDIELFKYSFGDPHSPPPLWRYVREGSQRLEQDLGQQVQGIHSSKSWRLPGRINQLRKGLSRSFGRR